MTTKPASLADIRGVEISEIRAQRYQRYGMLAVTVIPLIGVMAAIGLLWGKVVSAVDLGLLAGFYVVTGLGITVGFHRLLTHKSFRAPSWVRVGFAIAGSMALQGAVIDWVATHRRHHAYSDEFGDPHSPHVDVADGIRGVLRGLFHAHLGWMFKPDTTLAETWAPDLLDEDAIHRVHRLFPAFALGTFVLPGVLGGLITGSLGGAVTGFVWGGLVRIFLLHHVTWSINSICHFFGTRPFDNRDESRNNLFMALLAFGEGWHNGHHAFPASARHGLRWWEIDTSWWTIRILQLLGLARRVKTPSTSQLARRAR